MTISRPGLIEPYGTYFLSKSGGLKGLLGGKRVYLHENIRTVQVPEPLKQSIYQSIQEKGKFWGPQYDAVVRLAREQSRLHNEPIAIPSPKRARGILQPENEAFLVFEGKVAPKIAQTRFAGISDQGAIVKRIALGEQPAIQTSRFASIAENIRYNWAFGRQDTTPYNKNLLRAMTRDMERKTAELYGDALSYPGSYSGHGTGHARGVYENLLRQYERSPTLQRMATQEELQLRAKYHDIAKVADLETEPFRHGWAAAEAIKRGYFSPPDLASLSPASRSAIAQDIRFHTEIQPGLSMRGLATKIFYRPTATGKALATADRLDLGRFGVTVREDRLFKIPEESFCFTAKQLAADIATGRRDLPIGFQVKFVEGAVPKGYGKPSPAYPTPAKLPGGISSYQIASTSRWRTGYPATYQEAVKIATYSPEYRSPTLPGYPGVGTPAIPA